MSDEPLYRLKRSAMKMKSHPIIQNGTLTKRFHSVDLKVAVQVIPEGFVVGTKLATGKVIQESNEVYKNIKAAELAFSNTLWTQRKWL